MTQLQLPEGYVALHTCALCDLAFLVSERRQTCPFCGGDADVMVLPLSKVAFETVEPVEASHPDTEPTVYSQDAPQDEAPGGITPATPESGQDEAPVWPGDDLGPTEVFDDTQTVEQP